MNAEQVIKRINAAGGILTRKGDRNVAEVPEGATPLLDELRGVRHEANRLLQEREAIPEIPAGVRLVRWEPKPAFVMITCSTVVTDVPMFTPHYASPIGVLPGLGAQRQTCSMAGRASAANNPSGP